MRLLADQLARSMRPPMPSAPPRRAQRRGKRTLLRGKALALLRVPGEARWPSDPRSACGSGNFLYVALWLLLDLEKAVINLAATLGEPISLPLVSPAQLHGIEINPYAYELAQTTIRIGYIQWLRDNGFGLPTEPILKPLTTFRQMDAIMAGDRDQDSGNRGQGRGQGTGVAGGGCDHRESAVFGRRQDARRVGRRVHGGRSSSTRDGLPDVERPVCYWFEKARAMIEAGRLNGSGFLATNSFVVVQTGLSLNVSSTRATFFGLSLIVNGFWMVPRSMSRWSDLITVRRHILAVLDDKPVTENQPGPDSNDQSHKRSRACLKNPPYASQVLLAERRPLISAQDLAQAISVEQF